MSNDFFIGLIIGWTVGFWYMWWKHQKMLERLEKGIKKIFDDELGEPNE